MATIKSYTNLEQSKRLAEILPIESADMCYPYNPQMSTLHYDIPSVKSGVPTCVEDVPCWSLTALLSVLPDVHLKKYIYDGRQKYYATLIGIRQYTTNHYNNPVDACHEMILKLHEQNLL